MEVIYLIPALLLLLFVGLPVGLTIHQWIKRGGAKIPDLTKESVLNRVAIEYNENDRKAVLEMLDKWRQSGIMGTNEIFLAQTQLAILQLAKGDMQVVMEYTSEDYFSGSNDPRDIIVKAGYG